MLKKRRREEEDDGDKHYLTVQEQEAIWRACQSPQEKVMGSILFSTGMRVFGLCNIQKHDVYNESSGKILEQGKTLEKGNKRRLFQIFDWVKPHIRNWIELNHMIESPYLFPNNNDHSRPAPTMRFQTLFKTVAHRANLYGEKFHIHSVRHSVARNLIESGNTIENTGKFLGHANPATTAKFYAKLSTKETLQRMNMECLGGSNNQESYKPQIPSFSKEPPKKKRKKMIDTARLETEKIRALLEKLERV